jgi:hypothetical protein
MGALTALLLVTIKAPRTAVSVSGNHPGCNRPTPASMWSAASSNSSPRRSATATHEAYYRAACAFFAWLEQHDIGELADIEPMHVS